MINATTDITTGTITLPRSVRRDLDRRLARGQCDRCKRHVGRDRDAGPGLGVRPVLTWTGDRLDRVEVLCLSCGAAAFRVCRRFGGTIDVSAIGKAV